MRVAAIIWKGPNAERVVEKFDREEMDVVADGYWLKLVTKSGDVRRLIPAHRVVVAEYAVEVDKSLITVPGSN